MSFTLFDIETKIHWSFWLVVLMLAFTSSNSFLLGLWQGLVLLVLVIGHEYAHALQARVYGLKTSSITLFLLGGVAMIASFKKPTPWEEFRIAWAGPYFNLVVAFLFLTIDLIAIRTLGIDTSYLHYIWIISFVLGAFNLIPAYPMDGGRILRSGMSHFFGHEKGTKIAKGTAFVFASLFVVGGLFLGDLILAFIGGLIIYYNWNEK